VKDLTAVAYKSDRQSARPQTHNGINPLTRSPPATDASAAAHTTACTLTVLAATPSTARATIGVLARTSGGQHC